jgi:hypothetical protein
VKLRVFRRDTALIEAFRCSRACFQATAARLRNTASTQHDRSGRSKALGGCRRWHRRSHHQPIADPGQNRGAAGGATSCSGAAQTELPPIFCSRASFRRRGDGATVSYSQAATPNHRGTRSARGWHQRAASTISSSAPSTPPGESSRRELRRVRACGSAGRLQRRRDSKVGASRL